MKKIGLFLAIVIVLAATSLAQVPTSNHVVLLVEENHSYSSVVGNSAMPYLNSLASKYGLATQYYANTHPSIGNYFEMTTGRILTNNDLQTPASFPVSSDNIVRELMTAGKTWKSYAEGLPTVGYTGGDTGAYAVRHNPFAYFTDVQNSASQKLNLVPFSQFATDLANNQLPNFSYIVPNLNNDAHNGTLQQADTWLQQNIAPLLANAAFQQDGLLIITFDESVTTDTAYGGGHVATIVIGPKAKLGYKSATLYQHQSLLRTVLTSLGASIFPGASASAAPMDDMFTASTTAAQSYTSTGVTISSPTNGATVSSPVNFVASAKSSNSAYPITAMRIYVDNTSKYTVSASNLNTSLALTSGGHNVTIVAWDASGKSYWKSESITVSGTTTAGGVTVTSPTSGATVSSPVQFVASATSGNSAYPITSMRIYVDNVSAYTVSAASINTSLTLASGAHNVSVVAWDSSGKSYSKSLSITVGTASVGAVTISSPTNGATVSSPAQFVASAKANSGNTITSMQIYVDNASVYTVNAASLNTSVALASGTHSVVVQAWDNAGTIYKSPAETISVPSTVGTLSVTPTSVSFGSVNVGSSGSQTVTVSAAGASVTISQATVSGAGFSVSGLTLPATIAAGQSLPFTVKFAPTAAGSVTGSLSLVSNASNSTASIALSGTGATTAGTLSVSPSALTFGSVNVGSSGSQTVTVTASGASVTISQATVSGAGFSVSGLTLPATVAAGQSLPFTVKFAPTAAGSVTGSLSLVSNASNSTASIALSGTGVATTTPHSVKLNWAASTSSSVVGYNVYRGTVSGGPYTKLTTAPIAANTYTDTTVAAGATYYYVVTAVDNIGDESGYSNAVTAVVPTP